MVEKKCHLEKQEVLSDSGIYCRSLDDDVRERIACVLEMEREREREAEDTHHQM